MTIKKSIVLLYLLLFLSSLIYSQSVFSIKNTGSLDNIFLIIFSISFLFITAKVTGLIFKKIKIPQIIGFFLSGIILGPYALGNIRIPLFNQGIFPLVPNSIIPATPGLLNVFILSSVLIFFMLGLETDITVFIKYSFFGLIIGFCGVIITFCAGAYFSSIYFNTHFTSSTSIFFGILLSTTSIRLTASFLSKKSKIGLTERLTSISSVLYDNIIVIFLFTFFVFIIKTDNISALKIIDIKPDFTILASIITIIIIFIIGLYVMDKLNDKIKKITNRSSIFIIIFGLIIIFSYIFSNIGLPLIISAYILGLILSKSRLNFNIGNQLKIIYAFFIPIIFAFAGMILDLNEIISSPGLIVVSLICVIILITVKVFIYSLIGFLTQFNFIDSLKIGINSIPRGEITLILGVISYSYGLINKQVYIIIVVFVLFSILIYSLLQLFLKSKTGGTSKPGTVEIQLEFESIELNNFLVSRIIDNFRTNDFRINVFNLDNKYYHMKKDDLIFCITCHDTSINIESPDKEIAFVKNLIYEILLDLNKKIKDIIFKQEQNKELENINVSDKKIEKKVKIELKDIFFEENIIINLNANNKKELLEEMVSLLYKNGHIKDKNIVLHELLEREKIISTGMQRGVAIPHCKTKSVDKITMALGLKQEGINFDALDSQPCKIFIMIISPEDTVNAHMRVLMLVSTILNQEEARNKLLKSKSPKEIREFITKPVNNNQ